jgi:hypothetical protein
MADVLIPSGQQMLDDYMVHQSDVQGRDPLTQAFRPQTSAKLLKTWRATIDDRLSGYDHWMGSRR